MLGFPFRVQGLQLYFYKLFCFTGLGALMLGFKVQGPQFSFF